MSKRAGLRDSTVKLLAGAPDDFPADGNYLRISKALYPVIVEVGGNDVYKLEPGQDVTYPVDEGFTRIRVTTTAPIEDIVTITIGNNVKVGSVVIAGQVSIAGNLAGIGSTVKTIDDGSDYGATWASATPMSGNTPVTIIAPAANLNGALVIASAFYCYVNGSTAYTSLIAKNSAPTTNVNGDVLAVSNKVEAGGYFSSGQLAKPIKIPAGMGLYMISNLNQTTFMANAVYKLL